MKGHTGCKRNVKNDTREGTDVLRFFAALYTIRPASVIDALRCGVVENDDEKL